MTAMAEFQEKVTLKSNTRYKTDMQAIKHTHVEERSV